MCGIFGIINKKVSKFDLGAFCTLGVNNDSRGGDSCGIFIDGWVEYGVNNLKLFKNFMTTSKLLKAIGKCSIALGHCRKASIGSVNIENAQPIIIKNNNKIDFVLIHNGTIINYKELANKYIPNIDIQNMTDSKVMAYIFYNCGYDVLSEYIGAGAFVMVDYRYKEPKILLFKGESKLYEHSTKIEEERPLFCNYDKNEFMFSSITTYLEALRPFRNTYTLSSNKLITLENGELYIEKEYDRSNCYQLKVKVYSNFNYSSNYKSYWWEEVDDDYSGYDYIKTDYVEFDNTTKKYSLNAELMHGVYNLNRYGLAFKKANDDTIKVAFWEGILLKSPKQFKELQKYQVSRKWPSKELLQNCPNLVYSKSPNITWKNKENKWVISDSEDSNFIYTGIELIPFTCTKNIYVKGILTHTEITTYKDTIKALKLDYKNVKSNK